MLQNSALRKSGLYCGELRWGSQLLKFNNEGAVLHYNSFICLVDGYNSAKPSVYFATKVKKRTLKKLNKLLSKDKKEYYDYIYKDFYKKKPKMQWLEFNSTDSSAIYTSIKNGDFSIINDIFNQSDMDANGFDIAMNDSKMHLKVVK